MTEEKKFDWLDDTEEKELTAKINLKIQEILDRAGKKAEEELGNVEDVIAFNKLLKKHANIESEKFFTELQDLARAEFTKEETIALNFEGYPEKALFHTALINRDLPLLMKGNKEKPNEYEIKRRRESKDIIGKVTIDEIIEENRNIDFFDMVHYLGVCRLYDDGTTTFTPEMLVRATYSDKKKRVTEKQKEEATQSIDKLMRSVIDIDLSEDYRMYGMIKQDEHMILGENMLYARKAKLRHSNGSVSIGYEILKEPILNAHAFKLEQVDRLDNEAAKALGGKEDLLLTHYLSLRLASLMSDKNEMSNIILLESVYKHMDLKEPNRQKRAQIRNKIEGILFDWKGKKFVKDFEFIKQGRRITKFKITV